MPLPHYFTADDVRALPDDGNRYETVHGELLVTPAPGGRHQWALEQLRRILDPYLLEHGVKEILAAPADISFGPDTLLQPDLFVADLDRFRETWRWSDITHLRLAVEILSPSSVRADRFTKRRLYQEQRVPAYWVVDIEKRAIEVWTPDATFPVIERERLLWKHPLIEASCTIELPEVFSE
ncbi:MAG TPA: Uma2 family endonuclease [Gemmatimonadales bacterium]